MARRVGAVVAGAAMAMSAAPTAQASGGAEKVNENSDNDHSLKSPRPGGDHARARESEPGRTGPRPALLADAAGGAHPIDAGAFLGADFFSDQVELGDAFFDEQVPGSSFLLGLRAAYLVERLAPGARLDPQLWVEVETKLAFSSTGNAVAQMRDSFFSPVLGWRAHAMLALSPHPRIEPFIALGGGGETVVSSSPFMSSIDTDAEAHVGLGARYRVGPGSAVRADLRYGVTAGRADAMSTTLELHVGFSYQLSRGGAGKPQR